MSKQRFTWRVLESSRDQRLDQELVEGLARALEVKGKPPLSKSRVRALLMAGAVYLDRSRVRIASKPVRPGASIEVILDFDRLPEATREAAFLLTPEHILHEDEWLIAIAKPAGVPTQPTIDEARTNALGAVKKFLAARDGVPDPYVGLHHRLDRDTSGVLLFTKKQEANKGISDLFAGKSKGEDVEIEKTYVAIVARPDDPSREPRKQWTVRNHLGPVGKTGGAMRYGSVRSGGDPALTDFKLLQITPNSLFLEAKPQTGRTHQIRVHLYEEGLPILGDRLYSHPSPMLRENRLFLHAHRLEFKHPITGARIRIEAPIPQEFIERLERDPGPNAASADARNSRRESFNSAFPVEVPAKSPMGRPRPHSRRSR